MSNIDDALARARHCYTQRSWADAFEQLSRCDRESPLGGADLELLAQSAYLVDRDDDFHRAFERAHRWYLDRGELTRAARCAFWLGLNHLLRGEVGKGSGWLSTARRVVENHSAECVEAGYMLVPTAEQQLGAGDNDGAHETADEAANIGERFGDRDLVACCRHIQGRAWVSKGRIGDGLSLLDEAMVSVTSGEVSPLMTGLIYCSVIEACQQVFAFGRAREWTRALTEWCAAQPQMIAFTGRCLVHRAEIFQLLGNWEEAMDEARRAGKRLSRGPGLASALYQQGEVYRLRGDFVAAEEAFHSASEAGREPQPGLALLRLAQDRPVAAESSIRRLLETTSDGAKRARYLPAYVEIMLAISSLEKARATSRELDDVAEALDSELLLASASHARGALELAEGDARAAMASLRTALEAWSRIGTPYEAARVRVLLGRACRALGDEESANLEMEAARAEFERLGASLDVAATGTAPEIAEGDHGLTRRELQVLALVAAGKTNKMIAEELFVSPKTVDRHLSNIFDKLDVPSRAAATAYAYENGLL